MYTPLLTMSNHSVMNFPGGIGAAWKDYYSTVKQATRLIYSTWEANFISFSSSSMAEEGEGQPRGRRKKVLDHDLASNW